MNTIQKIGFGGGCHWCTEAVFQSLEGVINVQQGYIASHGNASAMSEAVIVTFKSSVVSLQRLVEIHLHSHNSTSLHSFRKKYRSAVYYYTKAQKEEVIALLMKFQEEFKDRIVTEVLQFKEFKASRESIQNYFKNNPEAPFCKRYIIPKLEKIVQL